MFIWEQWPTLFRGLPPVLREIKRNDAALQVQTRLVQLAAHSVREEALPMHPLFVDGSADLPYDLLEAPALDGSCRS
jgi:hypothetical protein